MYRACTVRCRDRHCRRQVRWPWSKPRTSLHSGRVCVGHILLSLSDRNGNQREMFAATYPVHQGWKAEDIASHARLRGSTTSSPTNETEERTATQLSEPERPRIRKSLLAPMAKKKTNHGGKRLGGGWSRGPARRASASRWLTWLATCCSRRHGRLWPTGTRMCFRRIGERRNDPDTNEPK